MESKKDHFLVTYLAQLAGLEMSPKETATYQEQLNSILSVLSELSLADTSDIEPCVRGHIKNGYQAAVKRSAVQRAVPQTFDMPPMASISDEGFYIVPAVTTKEQQ